MIMINIGVLLLTRHINNKELNWIELNYDYEFDITPWGHIQLWDIMVPRFLDNQLTGASDVSLMCWPTFTPGKFLVLISARGSVNPMAIVQLEGLG
jgi:hypothetical protein